MGVSDCGVGEQELSLFCGKAKKTYETARLARFATAIPQRFQRPERTPFPGRNSTWLRVHTRRSPSRTAALGVLFILETRNRVLPALYLWIRGAKASRSHGEALLPLDRARRSRTAVLAVAGFRVQRSVFAHEHPKIKVRVYLFLSKKCDSRQ